MPEYNRVVHHHCEKKLDENIPYSPVSSTYSFDGILHFLRRLSPGTCIVFQYDSQPPTTATFQGIQNGLVILSDFDCFPGLAHIDIQKINVISLGSLPCKHPRDSREWERRERRAYKDYDCDED
ncbi:hypothetical protein [Bacillus toyonensis]|uniref:hypothetical protein n=1 Tax=Bacillus toyonensis TaxID=155322 RepID=UPI00211A523F|nr:hypothetical protein [Bacillus toyonensis]MED3202111.1 hypothetical protein [Bacillus toyonensis]